MTPTKSNIYRGNCTPVSSNCVTWNGPDLPGIDLCTGATITEAMYEVAVLAYGLQQQLDLSSLDLKCLVQVCATCPQPVKTLQTILTLIINEVCTLASLIGNGSGGAVVVPTLVMAACFRYTDNNGDIVTSQTNDIYTQMIGTQVCNMLLTLTNQGNIIANHESRIDSLENRNVVTPTPQVNSICVAPGASTDTPIVETVDVAWEQLEKAFCGIETALGDAPTLIAATAKDPPASGNPSGVYSLTNPNTTLWTNAAINAGEMIKHLGLAVADLRSAVKLIQENCCKITCDDIIVDFDVKLSTDRQTATLFFITKSKIPVGYTDCNATQGNKLTITDKLGNTTYVYVKVATEANNPNGVTFDLTNTPIDPTQDYFFSMDACLTDGTTNCVKCVNKAVTYKDTCAYCQISVVGGGSVSGKLVVLYTPSSTTGPTGIVTGGTQQYVTILPGQTQVIPKSATINSVIKYGNIQYTYTCGTLPNPDAVNCYTLTWAAGNGLGSHATPVDNLAFINLSILGIPYNVGVVITDNEDPGIVIPAVTTALNGLLPIQQGIINSVGVVGSLVNNSSQYCWTFQTTEAIMNTMIAKFTAQYYTSGLYIRPIPYVAGNIIGDVAILSCPSS